MRLLKPYLILSIVAITLYLFTFGLYQTQLIAMMPSYSLETVLFVFLITAFIYRYVTRFTVNGPDTVARFYLLSIAVKLMAGCAFVVAIVSFDKQAALANVVLFLISYMIFTFAEVILLLRAPKN